MALLVALHVLAAVVWVGGMFFAYMVLRHSVGPLEPAARLSLWHRVFGRFFPSVWASIVLLAVSGYGMLFLYFGEFTGAGVHVHLMQGMGIVMILLFLHVLRALAPFWPGRRKGDILRSKAAKELDQIRHIVAINLVLGLLTVIVSAGGRCWWGGVDRKQKITRASSVIRWKPSKVGPRLGRRGAGASPREAKVTERKSSTSHTPPAAIIIPAAAARLKQKL